MPKRTSATKRLQTLHSWLAEEVPGKIQFAWSKRWEIINSTCEGYHKVIRNNGTLQNQLGKPTVVYNLYHLYHCFVVSNLWSLGGTTILP